MTSKTTMTRRTRTNRELNIVCHSLSIIAALLVIGVFILSRTGAN